MTIEIYSGEFLTSPLPLECSLNYCSAKCAFCFANLNQPNRTADMPAIMRLLADYKNRETSAAQLLQFGYPVVVSNRVDPFANSNYRQAVPMLETMTELGIPFAIQTRGGKGVDDVLEFAPPSVWYVSMSQLDDTIRARIEPGAPTIGSRFELIEKLVAKGHRVVLGLNPVVKDWLPDPEPLLALAKAAGATGAWIQGLHLNRDQKAAMSDRERAAMTLQLIDRAIKRHATAEDRAHVALATKLANDVGLQTFSVGQHTPTDFWDDYSDVYPMLFPVLQTFVNACWATLDEGDLIDFETFAEFFLPDLPPTLNGVDNYIRAKSRGGRLFPELLQTGALFKGMTWLDVLSLAWKEPRIGLCPARMRCFAFAGRWDGDGWIKYLDDNGRPFLVFTRAPEGTDEYYAELVEPVQPAEMSSAEASA